MSAGFFGFEMSTMSTSGPSSLSTITAYAFVPASHAKTLWMSFAAFLPWPGDGLVAEALDERRRMGGLETS